MASKDKVLLDSDVVLDHLADRQPFAEYAHRLFALAETGQITVCVSSLSFSNLYYLLRKLKGHAEAVVLLGQLKKIAQVAAVGDLEVSAAFASQFTDFEDALQHFAAKAAGVTTILTRNKKDFSTSEIPVQSPDEYLALNERPETG